MEKTFHSADYLVVGTGIAGLSFALKAADHGSVIILSKATRSEGSTAWAQGGIAAVFSEEDSYASHIQDTLIAGAGLCDSDAVKTTVEEGPARVRELIDRGVPFSKSSPSVDAAFPYDLTREGGHRARRILHAQDFTGRAIEDTLLQAVSQHPQIQIFENCCAIDLITNHTLAQAEGKKAPSGPTKCLGVYALAAEANASDPSQSHGPVHVFGAKVTVLATGGAGKVYLYTSNPDVATGDGIAMAYRAGARVANLEFMQFHPTCLFHPAAKSFLISEALRGEGAVLINKKGRPFMEGYHEMGSLAPRDIVARAIDSEMKRWGDECVYLDLSPTVKHLGAEATKDRFPNIYEHCLQFGIDVLHQPIPVVPAAHYMCGGVVTDLWGRTSVDNLYAVGEVACTGLHGANRLASNSLLEACVFAHRAFSAAQAQVADLRSRNHKRGSGTDAEPLPEWDTGRAVPMEDRIDINHTWKEIRTLMWDYVGIVRTNRRLEKANHRLRLIQPEVNEYYWRFLLTRDLIELRNLVTVSSLVVQSAMLRRESRGLHYNLDFPHVNDAHYKRATVL